MNRRSFLSDSFRGFSGIALAAMLQKDGFGTETKWSLPDGKPHHAPKAKSVIWLFMNGGVSHMETFDPKPALTKFAGKTIKEGPVPDAQDPEKLKLARVTVINDANGQQRNVLFPTAGRSFKKKGQSRHPECQRLVAAHRRHASTTSPSFAR